MDRCLMLIADGFEEIEAISVIDILRRCGIAIDVCSITGSHEIESVRGVVLRSDIVLNDLDKEKYHCVILPGGGPNAHSLRDHDAVIELLKDFYRKNALIAAICAAPIALERAGILAGHKVTSYPDMLSGQDYSYSENPVVTDQNVITSRGPATACDFAFTVAAYLGYTKEVQKVKKEMLF